MKFTGIQSAAQQNWLVRLDSVLRTQGMEAAGRLALQAVAEGVEHPGVMNLAASAHHAQGRYEDALQLLNRARMMAPNDPQLLNGIALCLKSLGRADEALQAFDEALRINPRMAAAHYNRGILLEELKYAKAARAAYEQAAALDSNYVDAVAGIAWLDAEAGDPASARRYAERALMRSPSHAVANLALASAEFQEHELDAAAARLSRLTQERSVAEVDRAIALGLMGDVLDAQGRTAEAFTAYQESNARVRAMYASQFEGPGKASALGEVKRLITWFGAADRAAWQVAPDPQQRPDAPTNHVFLVGFPRSGTTLLESVLAAHPKVVSLEERDSLKSPWEAYLHSSDGLERLARIGSVDAEREREAYWSKVRSFGVDPAGRVFIDKMPLASIALPLVAKLFPDALILFARRDPRDVVLSCFRRRFGMNPSMYELLTLDGAAAYYDSVMRLSELYRDILPLSQHVVRYESLVEDFEGTSRAACEFLGLEWNQKLTDFAAHARSRGISTPSAAQVARGLNRDGAGAWRRYREQLAAVLPLLEPWVRRFGYLPD